jgi:hypothetical protein
MNAVVLGKRLAVAAATAGLALSVGAPAFAGTSPTPRAGALFYTLDFTSTNWSAGEKAGGAVVGTGFVLDASGNQIGTVSDACLVVSAVDAYNEVAECTDTLMLPQGSMQVSTLGSISANTKGAVFAGIVQGGTGVFDGASGDVSFTTVGVATYQATIILN